MRLGEGTMSHGGINEMDEGLVPVGGGVLLWAPPTSPEGGQNGPHPDAQVRHRSGASGDAFPGKKSTYQRLKRLC